MRGFIFSIMLVVSTCGAAMAQEQPAQDQSPSIVMEPPEEPETGEPVIIGAGAIKLISEEWPATLKYNYVKPNGKSYTCTSTIVGEKVLITAAHCIGAGKVAEVRLPHGSSKVLCDHYPGYDGYIKGDVALCRATDGNKFKADFQFENIDLSESRITKGSQIFLAGYGCRTVNQELSGTLYGGFSNVIYIAKKDNEHTLTRGGVNICPGDSGGGVYVLADNDRINGKRYFVSINSAVTFQTLTSHLAPLYTAGIAAFVRSWAQQHELKICGVSEEAKNCRG